MPASNALSARLSQPIKQYYRRYVEPLDEPKLSQGAVLIPLFAGLVMPGTPSWAFIFYLTAIPPILLKLWRGWRPDWRNPALLAMLALWAWSALTIIWDRDFSGHGKSPVFWTVNALWTLVFLLNFVSAQDEQPATRRRAMITLIWGIAVNAVISLMLFVIKGHFTARLWGWGVTSNPVMGAAIMDIGLLLALSVGQGSRPQRLPMAIAAAPMLAYLALSYSRTALAAAAACLLLIFLGRRPLLAALTALTVALLAFVLWKFGSVLFPMLWSNLASRGDDCHARLWRTAWQMIRGNPVFGYGPSATLPNLGGVYCPPYPTPHDLYLCILLYSGGIGLALFVITVGLLWRHVNATTSGFERRLWLALGLVPMIVGISDLIQIIKGPSMMWYIFWVPMLLSLTLDAPRPATRASPPARARDSARPGDARRHFAR